MLDLQPFCGTEETQYYLMKPFSRDGFTWATDGCILIRVAQREGIPDIEQKLNVSKPIENIDAKTFFTPSFKLPPAPTETGPCPSCEGRGYAHDCPDCECECERCNAQGTLDSEILISTKVGGNFFSLKYVRQVLSLPGVEVSASADKNDAPLFFRFDGGVGVLMPLRTAHVEHVEIAA